MKAIVIGATGAIGQDLVKTLLYDDRYETVTTFTRRPLGFTHPKIQSFIVDFNLPDTWHHLVQGDVLFSALGTSLKQAGSKEAQYRVDHDYQLSFARAARGKRRAPYGAGFVGRSRQFFPFFLFEIKRAHRKGCGSSPVSQPHHSPAPVPDSEACQKAG